MECGIVGLPGSGKTCLFQALTAHAVAVEVGTLNPNIGQADIRTRGSLKSRNLSRPRRSCRPPRTGRHSGISTGGSASHATVLAHIRTVAALCHVVNCFDGSADPVSAYADLSLELILSDLDVI